MGFTDAGAGRRVFNGCRRGGNVPLSLPAAPRDPGRAPRDGNRSRPSAAEAPGAAIAQGRHAVPPPEGIGEMTLVEEARLLGDGGEGQIGTPQLARGKVEPELTLHLPDGAAVGAPETARQGGRMDPDFTRDAAQRETRRIVGFEQLVGADGP